MRVFFLPPYPLQRGKAAKCKVFFETTNKTLYPPPGVRGGEKEN